ncbi:MAG TPA: LPS assembly protein LptD [Thermoanaerobaculia bacterium]|jgi:lipopolysaccharide assembly outer membrane protein LptD (OstA)|nr:LPS assembly protein LptD [Thermoanaerobaculia bacterium]
MRGRHSHSTALLLALVLSLPVTAQTPQAPQQTPSPTPPELVPQGPIQPVAPTPGSQPTPGTPQTPPTPAPGTPAVPAPPAGPPGAGPGRLDFNLKFTTGKGAGSAAGSAATLDYKREDYAVLTGAVQIRYQDIDLKADQAEIDLKTKVVTAKGNVIIDQGPRRLTGDSATFNLDTKTGKLLNAGGQVAPDYYFKGREVEKTGPDTYLVHDGVFTSCTQPVPDWSFRLKEARLQVEGYAHVKHATMRAKKLPVFYTPYIVWPVKNERSSGLLIPNVGYSDRRGASLGLAYFQTLGRSYDTTLHADLFTKNFLGLGDEFRYRPTAGTRGDLLTYFVRDSTVNQWRWKVNLSQVTDDLPQGMRAVIQYQNYSDFNFFRDFERSFDQNTLRFIDSRGFLTGNWGANLVNLLLSSRETFINQDTTVTQRKLPELQYRLRSTRLLNTPLYLQVDSSLDYLDVDRPGSYTGKYGRFDLFPQLTLPVKTVPWLSLSVTGGERGTWYGDTLNADQTGFTGNSRTRTFPVASAEIVGPSFSKIFAGTLGGYKIKHIIEPRWTYTYQGEVKDPQTIPLFDEVDPSLSTATNFGRIALDNRILAKPNVENGNAREVFLFEIARNYSFNAAQPLQTSIDALTTTTAGPLEGLLRYNPTDKISLKIDATYDTLFKGISSTSLTGNYGFGPSNYVAATWFTRSRAETKNTLANQVRLGGGYSITPWGLRLEGQFNYDFEQQLLQSETLVANYLSQCYGVRIELRKFQSANGAQGVQDKEIRFSLTLKNVGTFLDLTSRTSTNQP